jgi:hypothetical protein
MFKGHLNLKFIVLNPNPRSKTLISEPTLRNMMNKDKTLGGYSVILERPPSVPAAQTGSGNTVKIVVPIIVILVLIGAGIVVFIIVKYVFE